MTLLPLAVAAILGGIVAWAARDAGRAGSVIGFLALILVAVLAVLLPPPVAGALLAGEPVALGAYARMFLVAAAVTGVLVTLLFAVLPLDSAAGEAGTAPAPTFLLLIGSAALALGITSPLTALLPAAAGGLAAYVGVGRLASPTSRRGGRTDEALDEAEAGELSRRLGGDLLRIGLALTVAVTAVELLVGLGDVVAGEPFGVGAASIGLAFAAALRLGIVPFHRHGARLAEMVQRSAVPVLWMWGPALFALAVLAAFEAAVIPLGLPLSLERGVIAGLAVLTIVAGGLGALVQDDLDHVVAYWILQDAGFMVLAFAASDPAVWGPARVWLLVLPVAKTALLAWAVVVGRTFRTRSLLELRGWIRRGPLLAVALVAITLASIGLPGLAAYEARAGLLRGALSEPIRTIVFVLSLTSVLVAGRVLIVGLDRPMALIQDAPDERLRRPRPDLRRRVGATARTTIDMNRAPLSASLVVLLAVVALAIAGGMFGLRSSAAADLPAGVSAGAQPSSPVATFQPVPTPSAS